MVANSKIVLPTKKGKVYMIDAKNGSIFKILNLSGKIVSSPVVKNNLIFITTLAGKIHLIKISDEVAYLP